LPDEPSEPTFPENLAKHSDVSPIHKKWNKKRGAIIIIFTIALEPWALLQTMSAGRE